MNLQNLVKTLLFISCTVFFLASSTHAATTFRLAGNFPTEHSSSKAMEVFKEELAKQSNGELSVDLFPARQLGGAGENVDQVRSGSILMTWIGVAYLSRTVPELEAVSLPFIFSNRDDAFKVIDGKIGAMLNEKLSEKGFTSLGYMELGFRNVTNSKRAIEKPEDFEGLKLRLQPNETHMATFRAIGANPVAMDIKELYSGLQQKVLDGQENPYAVIKAENFNEVQKYLSDSGHFFDYIIIVANKDSLAKMKPEHQEAIKSAMATAVKWQRKQAVVDSDSAKDALIEAGMVFTPFSDDMRQQLQKKTASIADMVKEKIGSEIIDDLYKELNLTP